MKDIIAFGSNCFRTRSASSVSFVLIRSHYSLIGSWCEQILYRFSILFSPPLLFFNAFLLSLPLLLHLILILPSPESVSLKQSVSHQYATSAFYFLFFPRRSLVYVACLCWCKGQEIPIYIWYDSYPTHSGEGYEGRVSRVSPNSPYGGASLNLTDIRESDQGWYECKVVFLNRSPNKNGTWFHLDVHGEYTLSSFPSE